MSAVEVINNVNSQLDTNFTPIFNNMVIAEQQYDNKHIEVFCRSYCKVTDVAYYVKYTEGEFTIQPNGVYTLYDALTTAYEILYDTNLDPTRVKNLTPIVQINNPKINSVIDLVNSQLNANFTPALKEVGRKMIIVEQTHNNIHLVIYTCGVYDEVDEEQYIIRYRNYINTIFEIDSEYDLKDALETSYKILHKDHELHF